jgi:sugar phosphate isomerase/epimerase
MKVLLSTGSLFYLPLRETFRLARETGFDGCELVINRGLDDPRYREVVAESAAGFPICSVHAPYAKLRNWGALPEGLARTIEFAREIGIGVVNFHPPAWYPLQLDYYKWFRKIADFQRELAGDATTLTIENMPLMGKRLRLAPYVLNDFKDLIEFGVRKNLCFTFDVTHLATFDEDPVAAFLAYFKSGRLRNIHLSDYAESESHLFLGRGDLPIVQLLNTMQAVGYDGMITLELAPNEYPRADEWLVKVMRYLASFIKMHVGRNADG